MSGNKMLNRVENSHPELGVKTLRLTTWWSCVFLGSWKINLVFYPSFIFFPVSLCWGSDMQVSLHLGSQTTNTDSPLLAWSLRVSLGRRVEVIWKHIQSSVLKLLNFLHILRVSAFGFYNRSDIKISSPVVALISNYVKDLFNVKYLYSFYFLFWLPPLVFLWGHSAHLELVLSLLQSLEIFFL